MGLMEIKFGTKCNMLQNLKVIDLFTESSFVHSFPFLMPLKSLLCREKKGEKRVIENLLLQTKKGRKTMRKQQISNLELQISSSRGIFPVSSYLPCRNHGRNFLRNHKFLKFLAHKLLTHIPMLCLFY